MLLLLIPACLGPQDVGAGGTELSVVTDRAQGATSLASGTLEVMVHRRTLLDDWRGVGEPLNETQNFCAYGCDSPGLIVRGTHLLAFQARPDGFHEEESSSSRRK